LRAAESHDPKALPKLTQRERGGVKIFSVPYSRALILARAC
jgi:hypothetical protein